MYQRCNINIDWQFLNLICRQILLTGGDAPWYCESFPSETFITGRISVTPSCSLKSVLLGAHSSNFEGSASDTLRTLQGAPTQHRDLLFNLVSRTPRLTNQKNSFHLILFVSWPQLNHQLDQAVISATPIYRRTDKKKNLSLSHCIPTLLKVALCLRAFEGQKTETFQQETKQH